MGTSKRGSVGVSGLGRRRCAIYLQLWTLPLSVQTESRCIMLLAPNLHRIIFLGMDAMLKAL